MQLYYSKAVVTAILATLQLVWNIASMYYQKCWANGNAHIGIIGAFMFCSIVPPDPFMGILYEIVFTIEDIYQYRVLYFSAAIVLLLFLSFLDVVVFLVVRARSDIGKERDEMEKMLRDLIAVTETRKELKNAADGYTDGLLNDHKNLLNSYYELQSQLAEMTHRAMLSEHRVAEAWGGAEVYQQTIKDLQHQLNLAEKDFHKTKQNSLYWKKSAMNADASWRSWSKTGAAARIEARELKARVLEVEAEAKRLNAEETKAKARVTKLKAAAVKRTELVEKLKRIASGAEDDFVKTWADQWEEIDRLNLALSNETKDLDNADEHIVKLMIELDVINKDQDELMESLADMTIERVDLVKTRDELIKERDDLKVSLAEMTKERDDLEEALTEAVEADWDNGNTNGGGDGAAAGSAGGDGNDGQDGEGEEEEL